MSSTEFSDKQIRNNQNLPNLLKSYMSKSRELEEKKKKVLKQIEMMDVAIKTCKENIKKTVPEVTKKSSSTVPRLSEIEEDTKKIKEETKKLQDEIKIKTEENKKLQDLVNQLSVFKDEKTNATIEYLDDMEEKEKSKVVQKVFPKTNNNNVKNKDSNMKKFNDKVKRLKEQEEKLIKKTEVDAKLMKAKADTLKKKIEKLENDTENNIKLLKILKRNHMKNH
ncbi:conserved hypothetical protein [Pediculus humanus corporis]|uniref:Uncharacterized protein n=1 Tax=Pediculus humanus subsp. corporis TaxID=121224 RepID=E0VGV5_PEDHC|nr:uncharacterized protein Phum_PHUM193890 [Pediculus humanus corporis]EEB12611.1 conserved hypothetical protein [Pediculus humanus corporis]